jgi:HAMP domain-containing protein
LYAVLRFVLGVPTRSISVLVGEAKRIAAGDLDHPLASNRVDEVGQLSNALNEMRLSLKTRLEEINRLLTISQGVASALEIEAAVNPILQGALSASGASAARLVLAEAAIPQYDPNMRAHFGFGPSAEQYAPLDRQVLALTARQAQVALANPGRAQLQNPGKPLPQALWCSLAGI